MHVGRAPRARSRRFSFRSQRKHREWEDDEEGCHFLHVSWDFPIKVAGEDIYTASAHPCDIASIVEKAAQTPESFPFIVKNDPDNKYRDRMIKALTEYHTWSQVCHWFAAVSLRLM